MAGESKLQARIHRHLRAHGWIVNKQIINSVNGWPDTIAVRNKTTIFLEIKDKGKKADPLQRYVHRLLRRQGFAVFVIDEYPKYLEVVPWN